MSAHAATRRTRNAGPRTGDTFAHLLDAESRPTVDSRAGLWLLTVTLGVVVLGAVAVLTLGTPGQATSSEFMLEATFPLLAVALPPIAILLVTGRPDGPAGPGAAGVARAANVPAQHLTVEGVEAAGSAPAPGEAPTTKVLAPQALRAKALMCAAIAVGVPLLVFTLAALGVLASAASQGVDVVWDVSTGQHLRLGVFALVATAAGFVAAVVARETAAALIGYIVLVAGVPAMSGLLASQEWFRAIGPWVDLPSAMFQLQGATMSGTQWLHLAAASVLWLALPAAVGLRRIRRAAAA